MNTINDYLNQQVSPFPQYLLSKEDKKIRTYAGLEAFVLRKVFSNKYRKAHLHVKTYERIEGKIRATIAARKPIRFAIPIGGYKNWHFATAPGADWAEFFNIAYMIRFIAPLVAAYTPGVSIEYYSNAWMAKRISFYPQADIDSYTHSFRKLISLFEPSLPPNVRISYNLVADQKDEEVLFERVLHNRSQIEKEWDTLGKDEQDKRLRIAERNIHWDLIAKKGVPKSEYPTLIKESKILHDCLIRGGWNYDLDYLHNDNKIPIIHVFRKTDIGFLYMATCAGSVIQFWSGTGIMEVREKKLVPRIVSFAQYEGLKHRLTFAPCNGIGLPHFQSIPVLDVR